MNHLLLSEEAIKCKSYHRSKWFGHLTRHAREVVKTIDELPVWDAIVYDENGEASVHYERRRLANGEVTNYPVSIMLSSTWSIAPPCGFSVDYRWTAEQSNRMLDWDRSWIDSDSQEIWRCQSEINQLLTEHLFRDMDKRIKFYGYLVGTYGGQYANTFTVQPIWKAESLILRLHYGEHENWKGTGLLRFEFAESLEDFSMVLDLNMAAKLDEKSFDFESYVIVPKRLLPPRIIELERQIENAMVFPPRGQKANRG